MRLRHRFLSLLVGCVLNQAALAQLLFPCSPTIGDDYGVCTHITRKWADFDLRDKELDLTRQAGIRWVRSDLDFPTYFRNVNDVDPQLFDAVMASCQEHQTQLLGILSSLGKLPWLDDNYAAYVRQLAERYDGRIRYWEALNEVNLYRDKQQLEDNYVKSLKTTYETLKAVNPGNQVLLSGLAEVTSDFLSQLSKRGAYRFFDVMNFHSYLAPEDLIPSFHRIDSVMQRDGWHKPVWLTECGMHTATSGNSSLGFFTDLLPDALRRVGINEPKITIGILRDQSSGYVALTDEEEEICLQPYCRQTQSISFSDLSQLNVKKVPVLVASKAEYFPATLFPVLVDYVRRGGTIILAGGMPFYYDSGDEASMVYHRKDIGTSLYAQLHMSARNPWNDNHPGEKLSDTPSVVRRCADADFTYQWTFGENSPARYLSDDNLQPGDSLISLISAGSETRQGTVAGIYKLRSDLTGNIIFQTRMYSMLQPDREAEQARRVARLYLLAFSHGISKVFWYNLRSREENLSYSEDCFGLIHADFSEKPAMQAYRTLVQMCPEGSTRPQLDDSSATSGLFKCRWTRPDGTNVLALWSPSQSVDYPLNHFKGHIVDHLGNPIPRRKSLRIGSGVVYLLGH